MCFSQETIIYIIYIYIDCGITVADSQVANCHGEVVNSLGEKSTGMGTCDMMGFRDNTTLQ